LGEKEGSSLERGFVIALTSAGHTGEVGEKRITWKLEVVLVLRAPGKQRRRWRAAEARRRGRL
jgi:hypothetical protein